MARSILLGKRSRMIPDYKMTSAQTELSGVVGLRRGRGGWACPPHRSNTLMHARATRRFYLAQSVLQKSILTQIRQLICYDSNSKGYVDGFGGELTSAKRG